MALDNTRECAKQRVLLVGPDQEENLSLRYLAAALLAAGHDTVIAPFDRAGDQASVLAAARGTTMVGISLCFQARAREFLELARALKAQAPLRPIVAGGHYASCAAEELLARHPELDLIAIHEGEETLVELADHADRLDAAALAAIRGLVHRDGGELRRSEPRHAIEELDALPTPLRMGPARLLAGVPTAYLLGSRGCLGACNYCCITTLHRQAPGRRFRQRNPERVAEEMAQLYHDRGIRQFIFHDDNFLLPSPRKNHVRLDALEAALREREVRDFAFTIKCRPQEVEEPVFRRLRELGLVRVFLGIESASEAGLHCLGRAHTAVDAEQALAVCRALGISAQYTMMIFHPDATLESCRVDLDFMRRQIDHPLNFCRTEIYAGTPLEQRMIAEGRARGSYLGRSYSILDARVERACEISTELFYDRCWANGSLIQHAIGLDHLAAVARRFYDGRRMQALVEEILRWRLEVNRDTVDRLAELVDRCEAESELGVAALSGREEESRRILHEQGLRLFEELNELTLEGVGLERRDASVVPARSRARRLARHAAAALLAVSAASFSACSDKGTSEYAPPPTDARIERPARVEVGVSEYAPPPTDARPEAKVKIEGGMSEFAPPPVDARPEAKAKIEGGMAEFAPPPLDAGPDGKKK